MHDSVLIQLFLYALFGLFVGLLVGFTAIGKGLIGTPGLILLFKMDPVTAVGTMSAAGFVMMISGSIEHYRNGNIVPQIALRFCITAIPAAILSAVFIGNFNSVMPLRFVIGIIIIISVCMLFYRYYIHKAELRKLEVTDFSRIITPFLGLFLGALMGTTAISGSIIVVLFMFVLKLPAPNSVGTTSFVAAAVLLVSSVIHIIYSRVDWLVFAGLSPGVIAGAAVGAYFVNHVPRKALRIGLLAVLVLSGLTVLLI